MKNKILLHIIFLVFCQCAISKIVFAQPPKVIFWCTGADQTYTVPEGITKITVKAWGAGGGEGDSEFNQGGGGGFAAGVLTVTPGDALTIIVGKGGCDAWTGSLGCNCFANASGSYGGGGARIGLVGALGGGRSAIRNALGVELITAGGGGGGGINGLYSGGGGGGLVGESNNALGIGGDPGTQTAGGNGYGVSGGGSQFTGGFSSGTTLYDPQHPDEGVNAFGGSGGGGYYGGGGGKDINGISGGGGGGGSSYVSEGGYTIGATGTIPGNMEDGDYPINTYWAGYGDNDGYVVIIPNSISTNSVSSPRCPGQNVTVNYTATGTFNANNIFTAQLSDSYGSFVNPTNIGQTASMVSGNIIATIPMSATGDQYRIRVISNDPAIWGTDNGSDILINASGPDICNGIDDNCNGVIDENAISATVNPSGTINTCSGVELTLTANTEAGISYQWKKGTKNLAGATNSTYSTSKAGSYKVYESNNFGCSSTSAVTTVNVLSSPSATITPLSNLDICSTGSVVLQANGGAGLTYQWIKGTNNITGETNQTYTATKKATYKVIVTNSNGCSKTSAGVKVTKSCRDASVENYEITSSTLTLYPNPTTGKFNINLKFNEEVNNDDASIELMNIIGQIVYSEKLAVTDGELKREISLDHSVTDGMYLARVMVNDKIYSAQLIYQK